MKKMRLDLDSLAVQSFDTSPEGRAERGTVRGLDSATEPQEPDSIAATCECPPPATNYTACGQFTCGQFTCQWTCDPGCSNVTCGGSTCWQTCPDSCHVCGPQEPQ